MGKITRGRRLEVQDGGYQKPAGLNPLHYRSDMGERVIHGNKSYEKCGIVNSSPKA